MICIFLWIKIKFLKNLLDILELQYGKVRLDMELLKVIKF